MAEQIFRSPGFFDREIVLNEPRQTITGEPMGVIGSAESGPAFVPIKVGDMDTFLQIFGSKNKERFGPYAVEKWLANRTACTYVRVLGAGANRTAADVLNTKNLGTVKSAGLKIAPVTASYGDPESSKKFGAVQFICAKHEVPATIDYGNPIFTDNDSYSVSSGGTENVHLVRAVLFTSTGSTFYVHDLHNNTHGKENGRWNSNLDDVATVTSTWENKTQKLFKLSLSCSLGSKFDNDDGVQGLRILTASLDPDSKYYVSKILNTDPNRFDTEHHLLYNHFPVDDVVASISGDRDSVMIASGSHLPSFANKLSRRISDQPTGDSSAFGANNDLQSDFTRDSYQLVDKDSSFLNLFGRFDGRYTTPRTTSFISQPFGSKEYNLFHFETLGDGSGENAKYKISIANLAAPIDSSDPYGSFDVQVRAFHDTDSSQRVLESYPNCNLNPRSDRFIGKLIGDIKYYFNHDADLEEERRIIRKGTFPNKSAIIRVEISEAITKGLVPATAVPFGFRGIPVLKTNDSLTDSASGSLSMGSQHGIVSGSGAYQNTSKWLRSALVSGSIRRLSHNPAAHASANGLTKCEWSSGSVAGMGNALSCSILPPLPFRYKATLGKVSTTPRFIGESSDAETVKSNLYWGVKNERHIAKADDGTADGSNAPYLPNDELIKINPIVESYTKFMGIQKLDTLVTGSGKDAFNNNKFTLARVALGDMLDSNNHITYITASAPVHMLNATYIRNGSPEVQNYTIRDTLATSADIASDLKKRITLATLFASSSFHFNKFQSYSKFTNIFYGGFDGTNFLDRDNFYLNDRASSTEPGGKARTTFVGGLGLKGTDDGTMSGTGVNNNVVSSYRTAINILTDKIKSEATLLATPGIRDPQITDFAGEKVKNNSLMMYIMDIPSYDKSNNRLFKKGTPHITRTVQNFSNRSIDNNYVATYYPDVRITSPVPGTGNPPTDQRINAPASLAAIGGFAATGDSVWFAPAGFSRGDLSFVIGTSTRLYAADRDDLYDARINPIATLTNENGTLNYVIFGQKNLQVAKSALDRVNVRRLMIDVKRKVRTIAQRLLFEPNTPLTRTRFVNQVVPQLSTIQLLEGIEQFKVVMDDTNNTEQDRLDHKLNGRIIIVPTRAVEFIAIDFVIDKGGVSFT